MRGAQNWRSRRAIFRTARQAPMVRNLLNLAIVTEETGSVLYRLFRHCKKIARCFVKHLAIEHPQYNKDRGAEMRRFHTTIHCIGKYATEIRLPPENAAGRADAVNLNLQSV
jgi:hypothetical protein